MTSFVFRLARLLRVHSVTERLQARALREALLAEERSRRVVAEQSALRDAARESIARNIAGAAPAGLLAHLSRAVETISARVHEAAEAHRKSAERVDAERQRYQEVRQKRRALERLRNRRKQEWMTNATRHEQTDLDELALRQHRSGKVGS